MGLPDGIDVHIPYMENSAFFECDAARSQYKVEPNAQLAQDIATLLAATAEGKDAVLVPGGSHHSTNVVGQSQYREALAQLFQIK